jgi:Putative phage tail protein
MSFLAPTPSVDQNTPIISSLQIQTSCYNKPLNWIFGATRTSDNIIQYDDFTPIPHDSNTAAGGKGGGTSQSTTYTYTAAIIMAICSGQIDSIGRVWKDKEVTNATTLGMDIYLGTNTQNPHPYFTTNHPTKALNYRGVAYLGAGTYDLGSSANVPNHSFEVYMPGMVDGTLTDPSVNLVKYVVPDARIDNVITAILENKEQGVGISSSFIGDLTQFSNFCLANRLWVSPNYSTQTYAYDMINNLLKIGFSDCFFSGNVLKIVPYSDIPVTGQYATYTPNASIAYPLTEDDFLGDSSADIIKVTRKPLSECYNHVRVSFLDRSNNYNQSVAESKDQGDIDLHGLRSMDTVDFTTEIADKNVAQMVADFLLHRALYVKNTYEFTLPVNYILLEPMDILQIEYPKMNLSSVTVLITDIEENDNGDLAIKAEEYQFGINKPSLKAPPTSDSYVTNFNVNPGNSFNPTVFEPPLSLTNSDPQIWLATAGGDNWGGCDVWASTDDASYAKIGSMAGKSRYGETTATLATGAAIDTINTLSVDLSAANGTLLSGTTDNANDLITACLIKDNTNGDEYLAYETATLTGTGTYNLTYLIRGAYGSSISAHPAYSSFVRLTDPIFKYSYPASWIGKTIYLKLVSYNKYQKGYQDLSAITAHTYQVTGAPVGMVQNLRFLQPWVSYDAKITWDLMQGVDSYDVQVYNSTSTLVRQVNGLKSNAFTYSHDDAIADGAVGRTITIKVRARSITGAVGHYTSITGNNPQLSALSGISVNSGIKCFFFSCTPPTEVDFSGIILWISTTSTFTPDDTYKIYDGQGTFTTISKYHDGTDLLSTTTYYVKAAGYDLFGKDSLNISSSFTVNVFAAALDDNSITSAMIQDGAITLTKHATGLQPIGIYDTLPNPVGYAGASTINVEGKLYRLVSGAWTSAVPTTDLTGTIINTQIAPGAVDTSALASNAVNASKIASSAVGLLALADGAVSAAKTSINAINAANGNLSPLSVGAVQLMVVPKSMIADPSFQSGADFWGSHFIRRLHNDNVVVPLNCPIPYASEFKDRDQFTYTAMPVQEGEQYKVSVYACRGTEKLARYGIAVYFVDKAGICTGSYYTTTQSFSGWEFVTGSFEAPTGTAGIYVSPFIDQPYYGTNTCWFTDLNCEKLADESLIVNGAITTKKLFAEAVTADKIAANSITSYHIEAASISGDRLAARTITSNLIYGGAIGADQLAANSIVAGKVAAGAIGTQELAAGAITADKLSVTVVGVDLNADTNFSQPGLWSKFSGTDLSFGTGLVGASPVASTFAYTSLGQVSDSVCSHRIPVDPTGAYKLSVRVYADTGNDRQFYVYVNFYDVHDTIIITSWGLSDHSGFVLPYVTPMAGDWDYHSDSFGYGGSKPIPSNATYFKVGVILNYTGGSSSTTMRMQDLEIQQIVGSTLIQDGAITTDKIQAGGVTADRIQANSLTSSQIQAGGIATVSLAANSITASKLNIASVGSALNKDPNFLDQTFWTVANGTITYGTGDGVSASTYVYSSGGNESETYSIEYLGLDPSKTYRLSANFYAQSGNNGSALLFVDMFDASGGHVSSPWGGTYSGYPYYGTPPTGWSFQQGAFGYGISGKAIPSNVVKCRIGFYLNYFCTSGTKMGIQGIRLEEIIGSTLIQDGAITTNKITVGTLNADRLLAGSITAAQIQAGAISTNELAANAVTASKLAVSSLGSCLNKDPNFTDSTAWTVDNGILTFATGDGVSAATYAYTPYAPSGGNSQTYSNEMIAIDPGKTYRLSAQVYAESGNDKYVYLFVDFFDKSGSHVSTAWGGSWSGYPYSGIAATGWNGVFGIFGNGVSGKATPSNVVQCRVGMMLNFGGSSHTKMGIQSLRLEEVIGSTLIQDGAITTNKIVVGSLNADRLLANSITASLIASRTILASNIVTGTLTANEIANTTLTGSKFVSGTITGSLIAGATITGSNISSSTIDASHIATNTLTADLIVSNSATEFTYFNASIANNTNYAFPYPNRHSGHVTVNCYCNLNFGSGAVTSGTATISLTYLDGGGTSHTVSHVRYYSDQNQLDVLFESFFVGTDPSFSSNTFSINVNMTGYPSTVGSHDLWVNCFTSYR